MGRTVEVIGICRCASVSRRGYYRQNPIMVSKQKRNPHTRCEAKACWAHTYATCSHGEVVSDIVPRLQQFAAESKQQKSARRGGVADGQNKAEKKAGAPRGRKRARASQLEFEPASDRKETARASCEGGTRVTLQGMTRTA